MKLKNILMVPAISIAASTSALSQAAVAEVPAAAKVNKTAEDFEAQKSDKMLDDLVKLINDVAKKDGKEVDAKKIVNVLGLDSVTSYAYSSDKQGEEWLNLVYLHDNGAQKGIFKMLGNESVKYSVPEMCPQGTDLAFQMKMNLGNVEEMIKGIMEATKASDEGMEDFEDGMNEEVPEMDMTVSTMLKKINVNVNFALDMDPAEKLPLPQVGAIDKPRLVIRVDNITWAWAALDKQLKDPDMGLQRSEKDGVIVYSAPDEFKMMLMGYSPLIAMDTKKGQLWFSTSPQFLKRCKSGENSLATDEDFQLAMKGLPKKGNSLFYMSKDFSKFIVDMIEKQQAEGNVPKEKEIEDMLKQLKGVQTGLVQTYTRDETGSHMGSRSNQSMQDMVTEMKKAMDKAMKELK